MDGPKLWVREPLRLWARPGRLVNCVRGPPATACTVPRWKEKLLPQSGVVVKASCFLTWWMSANPCTIEPILTPLLGLLLHTTLLIQGFHCTQSELNQLAFELWCQMPHALLHQHYHTVFSFNSTPTTSQTKHTQNNTIFHIILPFSNTTH